jgi:hypothetical protein
VSARIFCCHFVTLAQTTPLHEQIQKEHTTASQ